MVLESVSTIIAALLTTMALGLQVAAGWSAQFIVVTAQGHGILAVLSNSAQRADTQASLSIFHAPRLGWFQPSSEADTTSFYDLSTDPMWKLSRAFLSIAMAVGAISTALAWLMNVYLPPTQLLWKIVSFSAAFNAVMSVPVYLMLESYPCVAYPTQQTCTIGIGSYLLVASIALWIAVVVVTQFCDPPGWADQLEAWRIQAHSDKEGGGDTTLPLSHRTVFPDPTESMEETAATDESIRRSQRLVSHFLAHLGKENEQREAAKPSVYDIEQGHNRRAIDQWPLLLGINSLPSDSLLDTAPVVPTDPTKVLPPSNDFVILGTVQQQKKASEEEDDDGSYSKTCLAGLTSWSKHQEVQIIPDVEDKCLYYNNTVTSANTNSNSNVASSNNNNTASLAMARFPFRRKRERYTRLNDSNEEEEVVFSDDEDEETGPAIESGDYLDAPFPLQEVTIDHTRDNDAEEDYDIKLMSSTDEYEQDLLDDWHTLHPNQPMPLLQIPSEDDGTDSVDEMVMREIREEFLLESGMGTDFSIDDHNNNYNNYANNNSSNNKEEKETIDSKRQRVNYGVRRRLRNRRAPSGSVCSSPSLLETTIEEETPADLVDSETESARDADASFSHYDDASEQCEPPLIPRSTSAPNLSMSADLSSSMDIPDDLSAIEKVEVSRKEGEVDTDNKQRRSRSLDKVEAMHRRSRSLSLPRRKCRSLSAKRSLWQKFTRSHNSSSRGPLPPITGKDKLSWNETRHYRGGIHAPAVVSSSDSEDDDSQPHTTTAREARIRRLQKQTKVTPAIVQKERRAHSLGPGIRTGRKVAPTASSTIISYGVNRSFESPSRSWKDSATTSDNTVPMRRAVSPDRSQTDRSGSLEEATMSADESYQGSFLLDSLDVGLAQLSRPYDVEYGPEESSI
jgi:hypothetical protein